MKRMDWTHCTPEEAGISSGAIAAFLDRLATCETEPHGLMMLRSGKLFFSTWWKPYRSDLAHGLQSLTKTFSGTAIGLLITEGKLSLDTKVVSLFPNQVPEEAGEYLRRMTVRDVLCMGTGMEAAAPATDHWVEDFFQTPVLHPPGTAFYYNNPGSNLLAEIVRRVSGESMMNYLERCLFPYIGIEPGSISCLTLPNGTEVGGGGMCARLEDCVRLMQLYMNDGVAQNRQVLSPEWVRLSTSCQNAAPNPNGIRDCQQGYGFQMWRCSYPGAFRADGAMGQYVVCFPDKSLIIAIHETASYPTGVQQVLDAMYDVLLPAVKDHPLQESPEATEQLRRRAESLSCPAPFTAISSQNMDRSWCGQYQIKEGRIPWVPAVTWMVTGKSYPDIQMISFQRESQWTLTMETTGGIFRIVLPEKEKVAETVLPGIFPYDQALVQTCVTAKNRLEMDIRYIQTCYHVRFCFTLEKDVLRIQTNMADLLPVNEEAIAYRWPKEEIG